MSDFSKSLKLLRKRDGLTQQGLAAQLGVSRSAVGMYEAGERFPDEEGLEAIADLFNVDMNTLLGVSKYADGVGAKKIPVLGYVAAGIPLEAIEDVVDYEEIPAELAKRGEYFGLKIKGTSMEPRIKEGDVVIVRIQPDVENGEVAVVFVNGDEATCKRIIKHDTGIYLESTNPAFGPLFYTNEQVQTLPIRILGKVVELRGKV